MTYEFDGTKYGKASSHQTAWGTDLMSRLDLQGAERILDLGCGDGRTTSRLARLVPQGSVVGVDASPGMIEAALKNVPENCTVVHMDMNDLSWEQEFDVIFSNAALHWIINQQALMYRIYKALRPGGVFLAEFAAAGNCENFMDAARAAMEEPAYAEAFSDFAWPWNMPAASEFEHAVKSAGFTGAAVRTVDRSHVFADRDALIAWIDQPSIVPFLAYLPPELRQSFRENVINRTTAATLQPDGTYLESFWRLQVEARK